jgi:PAS domain S-box-containing protein
VDVEVTVTYAPLHGGSFFSIIRDISHQKQTEKDLQQSNRRYRDIVESQTEFVDRYLPGGILTYVNPALARFTGIKAESLLGKSFYQFIHEAERDDCVRLIESISSEFPTVEIEGRIIRSDGTIRWTHWSQTGVFDEQGSLIEYQALGKDITEQKVAENALRESELKYRLLFESAGDSISVMDMQGKLLAVNPQTSKIIGYTNDELLSLTADKIDSRPNEMAANIGKLLENGYYFGETEFVRKDGSTVPISVDARLIVWDGQNAILNICRDITDHKQAQEEQLNLEKQLLHVQKLESLGVMAGGIAHDFNNLLQSIQGNIDLAARALRSDSESQKYLSYAMNSAKRAAHLTNLMLTYAGKGLITKKNLNLNDHIKEHILLLRSAASTSVPIQLSLSADLPEINADEAQIQQVVMNLITNAAESIDKPEGNISIITGIKNCVQKYLSDSLVDVKLEPGSYVYLEVKDNGCGMSQETLKRLFDPFFTTKFTGRGLGMSAVMGILKSHKGALLVESEPGKGTTFRVLFPISTTPAPANDKDPVESSDENCTSQEKVLSGAVLVVDDEKSVLRICTKMVQLIGFNVITASDGLDAVAKYRKHQDEIELVLMDLTMPNMDGLTAMAEIYSIRPDIKVILSSGYNKEELSERITGKAPSGFIRKPYSLNDLEAELQRAR